MLVPGIIFSILNPLMDPAWATFHGLEAKTWTSENSLGSLFSTVHTVWPLRIRENMNLDPFLTCLISTAVHSSMRGFLCKYSMSCNRGHFSSYFVHLKHDRVFVKAPSIHHDDQPISSSNDFLWERRSKPWKDHPLLIGFKVSNCWLIIKIDWISIWNVPRMAKKGHHDNMSIKSFAFEVLRMFVENEKY